MIATAPRFTLPSEPKATTRPTLVLEAHGKRYRVTAYWDWYGDDRPVHHLEDLESGETFAVVLLQDERRHCRCSCSAKPGPANCRHVRALASVGIR